ncbi:hypothetical protein AB0D30_31160 [Streptomyces sp. NPDC048409]|uniref:hypothetical protein n=1 Tax=Streptomyces sp. NPDC048409 TaxID=3154723 RepID=UPI003436FFD9
MPVRNLLRTLLDEPGITGAALVDAVTGLVYGGVGRAPDGEECSRFAVLVEDGLQAAGARGALESIVITGARHQVVLRILPRHTDPLLLSVACERGPANLALIARRLDLCGAELTA